MIWVKLIKDVLFFAVEKERGDWADWEAQNESQQSWERKLEKLKC